MTYSPPTSNPSGGAGARRAATQPALDSQLMERVVDPENVRRAWKRVQANYGAPGIDGLSVEQTEVWLHEHWTTVRQSLLEGTYQPQPLRRKAIPKRRGGKRLLGIPSRSSLIGCSRRRCSRCSPRSSTRSSRSGVSGLDRRARFVRYVDDILIVVHSRRAAERVKASVTRYLTGVLHLSVNEEKNRVAKLDECVFLGFTFMETKLRWSDEAYQDLRYQLRRLTGRSWGVSMAHRYHRLRLCLRGWMNFFGISDYYRPIPVDHWLRRRVRMCYWKQWRKTRTKVRRLLALGVSRREAVMTALSRKGYWHLAKTLATQVRMTNAWLQQQGLLFWLLSIRDLWMKAHGYA